MIYNYDKIINRKKTCSLKWDTIEDTTGEKSIIPMSIADMDFTAPYEVMQSIEERLENGIFGYSFAPASYYNAIVDWVYKRHNWNIEKEWIEFCPGVIPALNIAVSILTNPGDKIAIQSPVYTPFFNIVKNNSCQLVNNQLKQVNSRYVIDFDELEENLRDPLVKVMIFCSPHNPVGRVWSKDELLKVNELCLENNVILISDEIHSDIVFKSHRHIPAASIDDRFTYNTITCISASKTFNIAGLSTSSVIIPNPVLREKFYNRIKYMGIDMPNALGIVAAEAVYKHGHEWLEQLLDYLWINIEQVTAYFSENTPQIKIIRPEGTFLVWLDFRETDIKPQDLSSFIYNRAKVKLNDGALYGPGGQGFLRMNIACPRSDLSEALRRIVKSL